MEVVLDGPLDKTKYCTLRIKFQERGSPHVHAFVWILDAPRISDEIEYKSFVEKTISAVLPDPESELGLFELVNCTKFATIQGRAGNIEKINAGFHMGFSFQTGL